MNSGLTNSTGWNLIGTKGMSIHLFDPLTSVPKNKVNTSKNRERKNK